MSNKLMSTISLGLICSTLVFQANTFAAVGAQARSQANAAGLMTAAPVSRTVAAQQPVRGHANAGGLLSARDATNALRGPAVELRAKQNASGLLQPAPGEKAINKPRDTSNRNASGLLEPTGRSFGTRTQGELLKPKTNAGRHMVPLLDRASFVRDDTRRDAARRSSRDDGTSGFGSAIQKKGGGVHTSM
jgi:hypothetical protein